MTPRSRLIVVYWLPALAWAAVVLTASSDLFSADHSGSVIAGILDRVVGHKPSPSLVEQVNFIVRKASHIVEYGILGALLFRALRGDELGRWDARWALLAIVLAAAVAATYEVHQSFVPSRTGTPWDVLLDTVAATFAQGLIAAFARRRGA